MRSHILRDIVAGGVGALLVLALIGLPGRPFSSGAAQPTRYVLLPAYRSIKPGPAPCLFAQAQQSSVKANAQPCPRPPQPAGPPPVPSP